MKILLLMPLDEQHVHMATAIYKNLTNEAKQICFAIPQFMEYLIDVKISPNWTYAVFDALIAAKNVYNAAGDRDLIVIGNMPKDFLFDKVFNFQEINESLPYQDNFIEKLKELCAEEPKLINWINNLYTNEDSALAMQNCMATADFLSQYIQTDPHLEEITKRYNKKVKEKK